EPHPPGSSAAGTSRKTAFPPMWARPCCRQECTRQARTEAAAVRTNPSSLRGELDVPAWRAPQLAAGQRRRFVLVNVLPILATPDRPALCDAAAFSPPDRPR